MTSQTSEKIPTDGVSKKLKVFVLLLTAVTLMALVAVFTKLAMKPREQVKVESTSPTSNKSLIDEYSTVGTRLMNSGLREQAIDQFVAVWEMQEVGSPKRAKAAQTVGRLYADLGNCQEALVWLFRAEAADSTLPLQPLMDSCLAKIRSVKSSK